MKRLIQNKTILTIYTYIANMNPGKRANCKDNSRESYTKYKVLSEQSDTSISSQTIVEIPMNYSI